MTMSYNERTWVRGRFARSVRIDSNTRAEQLEGYLPTARALEVVRRVLAGMASPNGNRAFSITGPYGSGKSSLAAFLDALFAAEDTAEHRHARAILADHDPDARAELPRARESMGCTADGFARALITAPEREPIAVTVLRSLVNAAQSPLVSEALRRDIEEALGRATSRKLATPSYRRIRELLEGLAQRQPVLLVIDEFGKNLEAYARSGSEADLYLLQELAEWAADPKAALRMTLITIQHLAFEDYATETTTAQRREWAKVQGRFEDIPFVDSAAATRSLIAEAFEHDPNPQWQRERERLAAREVEGAEETGLAEVASLELVQACWPLHPTTLLALPDLCARYGQNERTLFSFLASAEPLSVTSWLQARDGEHPAGWVRLDRVYDYFVESASTVFTAAGDGGRWVEVETAVRDATGLTDAQLRVLKAVGLLNLVSASGPVRASAEFLAYAIADGAEGTTSPEQVEARLSDLQDAGLLTYRAFADEYRLWQGSDFDLESAVARERRAVRNTGLAGLLERVRPMEPLVAARHATETGTLRAFARVYGDRGTQHVELPSPASLCDGVLIYALEPLPGPPEYGHRGEPMIMVEPDEAQAGAVVDAAAELAALSQVEDDPQLDAHDRAARRELAERAALARQRLDHLVDAAFGSGAQWRWLNAPEGEQRLPARLGTSPLSDVFDEVFAQGPREVRYEVLNRAELTSAGAKARRVLLGALVDPQRQRQPALGLEGEGPEVAMYWAVLHSSGIHEPARGVGAPHPESGWDAVWNSLLAEARDAGAPVSCTHLLDRAMAPPFGLRQGTAGLLLVALIVANASDLAIYEHGTFKPQLSAPLAERLVRNPGNFSISFLGASHKSSLRYQAMKELHAALDNHPHIGDQPPQRITVLTTVQRLARIFREGHSSYAAQTKRFFSPAELAPSTERAELAASVRDALATATEPDALLFEDLPKAAGFAPLGRPGRSGVTRAELPDVAQQLADALVLLRTANDRLSILIADEIFEAVLPSTEWGKGVDREHAMAGVQHKAAGIESLDTLSQPVRTFVSAAQIVVPSITEWTNRIAASVTDSDPRGWRDHEVPAHLRRIREVARSFRRIADLAEARARYEDGDRWFKAFGVSVTSADGRADDRTVVVRESQDARHVTGVLHTAVGELQQLTGYSRERTAELLLAELAEELLTTHDSSNGAPNARPEGGTGTDG